MEHSAEIHIFFSLFGFRNITGPYLAMRYTLYFVWSIDSANNEEFGDLIYISFMIIYV